MHLHISFADVELVIGAKGYEFFMDRFSQPFS